MLLFSKLNLYASNTFLCFITADLCSHFALCVLFFDELDSLPIQVLSLGYALMHT